MYMICVSSHSGFILGRHAGMITVCTVQDGQSVYFLNAALQSSKFEYHSTYVCNMQLS